MQRIIIVLLFVSALSAAYFSGKSPAQPAAPRAALTSTKVGIVNISLICSKYDKFKDAKADLEKMTEPFKAKQKELDKLARDWAEILKDRSGNVSEKTLLRGQKIVIDCKRQLEDLEQEYRNKIGNRAETLLVEIWKEVNDKVRGYSDQHGFHLILGYGDTEEEQPAWKIAKRKMAAVDAGGLTPAYAAGAIDITSDVLRRLNDSYRAAHQARNDADPLEESR